MAKKKVVFSFGADLSELEKGWKRLEYKVGKFTYSAKKTGQAMANLLTVPLMAVGGVATKAALDVEKAMQNIARGTGATGKALSDLQAEWKSLSVSVSQSFDVSSKALADYNTRLGLTGKALSGLSKQALDAGRMMGEDVSQLVAESAKAMQDWGVKSKETALFMDKVFLAAQNTGIGMSQLSTHMYKYGSALRQIGFDVDTTIAVLAQFEKQGVNTELVFGSLRISLSRMAQAGIKDAGEAFRLLTEDIKKTTNPVEATRKAIDLFGSKAGPDMAAAIREGRFEISDLLKVLAVAQGAIETNSDATKTFGDRWSETKNKVSMAMEPIGREILQLVNDSMPSLQNTVESVGKAMESMSEESRKSIVKLAALLGVGGPFLIALSASVKAVMTLGGTLLSLVLSPAAPFIVVAGALLYLISCFTDAEKRLKRLNREIAEMDVEKLKKLQGQPSGLIGREGIAGSIAIAQDEERRRHGKENPPLLPNDGKATPGISKVDADISPKSLKAPNGNVIDEWKASIEELWASLEGGSGPKKPPKNLDQTWQIKRWENAQGFLGDEAYYAKLREDLDSLAVGSEAWRDRLTEVQAVAGQIAAEEFRALSEKLDGGKISTEEFGSEVEALKAKFEGLPGVIRDLDKQTGEATRSDKWQMMSWENSQGLLDNEDYYARLKEELDALVVGSDAWRARFSEVQAIAGQMASAELTALGEKLEGGKLSTEEWKAKVEALKKEYEGLPNVIKGIDAKIGETTRTTSDLSDMTKLWANDLARGLADALVNARDLGDVLSNIAKQMASSWLQKLIGGWLGLGKVGLNAKGNVFSGGQVTPFAKGGVVTTPTFFPMARGGMGLMGEAGPEAVMPLHRGSDGKLGVRMNGAGARSQEETPTITNVTMNVTAVDARSFMDMLRDHKMAVQSVVIESLYGDGQMRKAIRGAL